MNWIVTYWLVAVALDWSSTIAFHDWKVEENPLMRFFWREYGDLGFTAATVLIALFFWLAIFLASKFRLKVLIWLGMVPVISFKVLIALTNLVVIPYWVTGWFPLF